MKSNGRATPWWLNVVAGIMVIALGIFLLVSTIDGNGFLTVVVGVGLFIYCVYNIIKALQHKNDNSLFIPHLAHGLLDLVLLLLIITIPSSRPGVTGPQVSQLIGIIISCWLIIFGFFEMISKKNADSSQHRLRNGLLLFITGAVALLILLLIQINYVTFLGIVALLVGIIKIVQGLMNKVKNDEFGTGSRSGLF